MSKKIIYFVRHGESELNKQGVRQGPDGPLSAKGRDQALQTAKKFPKYAGRPQIIISSPYQRAKETAEIIGAELGMKIYYSDLLAERRNPSIVVGKHKDDREVRAIMDKIDKSFHEDNFRYSDEENFEDLKDRAGKLLKYISKIHRQRIIMVTHSIFLKMVISYMLYGDDLSATDHTKLSFFNPIDNAGMTIVEYIPHWFKKAEWKLLTWNDEM